jgi:eukaryotic-like serine/threonine-protein kinase
VIVPVDAHERVFGTPPELDELAALARVRGRMLGVEDPTPRIGRYRIVGRLGQGGMGLVHAAHDDELDRAVAIKVLRRDLAGADARARFLREAQALARLSHPNVVQVYEVGHHDDEIYIAMELVEGITLRKWCAAEVRSWREIVRVFHGAGRGLAAAHRAGLVHRDFKPDNVLISTGDDGEPRPRVVDFGVAHFEVEPAGTSAPSWVASASGSMTQPGSVMGTVAYMAPEQRWGLRADARADQYAFALSLYEALHGHRPPVESPTTERNASVPSGALDLRPPERVSTRSHASTRERPVPKWLRSVLERAMATDADERWESMDELLDALAGPKRRAKWIALGVGVTLAIGASAFAADRAGSIARCETEAAELGAWWQGARVEAKAGLVHTGVAEAATTWSAAAPRFDEWVDEWTVIRVEVCRETEVEHASSADLLAASRACLDERRAWLEALVGIWSHAEELDVHGVAPAAAAVPPLAACADPILLQPRLDELAHTRSVETLRAGRARLFRAEASRRAGRRADGIALVSTIVDAPDEDPALRAEALTLLGRLHGEVGEFAASESAYERAIVLATEAGRADIVGEAAAKLVFITGVGGRRFDDAAYWSDLAEAAFTSANVPVTDPRRIALVTNRGTAASARGAYDEALARHREAYELWESALGPDHLETITCLENIAVDLSYLGRYDEAIARHELVLARRERVLGRQHPLLGATIDNLGNVLRSQDRLEEALALHERGLALHQAAYGPEHPRVADSLENLASDLSGLGEHARALELYSQALDVEQRTHGDDTVDVARILNNMSGPLVRLGRGDEALAGCERALSILERVVGLEHPDAAWTYLHLGEVQYDLGRFAEARAALGRAVEIRERTTPADGPELADARLELARATLAAGDPAAAAAPLARAAVVLERAGTPAHLRERAHRAQTELLERLLARPARRSRTRP